MTKNILVTGATGTIASQTIPHLKSAGCNVTALLHDVSKQRQFLDQGIDVWVADYADHDSIKPAFEGIDAAFLIAPPNPDAAKQMHNLIKAAKKASRPHVLRLSALKAARDAPTENGRLHHKSDQELRASGLPYTLLRPHFFMQNVLMGINQVQQDGKMYWGMGQGRLGMVDARDIGECAAAILTDPDRHEGRTYTPTGPQSITFEAVASSLSEVMGHPVEYVAVPPEQVRQSIIDAGMGSWVGKVMADYSKAYSRGWGDFTTRDVEALAGHKPRTIQNFAREVAVPALHIETH